jgi:bacterioferritin (cytochrome b1)
MYKGFLADLPPDDPTTRRLIEEILADEERHADDARTILAGR